MMEDSKEVPEQDEVGLWKLVDKTVQRVGKKENSAVHKHLFFEFQKLHPKAFPTPHPFLPSLRHPHLIIR